MKSKKSAMDMQYKELLDKHRYDPQEEVKMFSARVGVSLFKRVDVVRKKYGLTWNEFASWSMFYFLKEAAKQEALVIEQRKNEMEEAQRELFHVEQRMELV